MPSKGSKSDEKSPNPTLPLLEFQKLERLASGLDWSTAAFSRMLIRWALPRWRDAWADLGESVATDEEPR